MVGVSHAGTKVWGIFTPSREQTVEESGGAGWL